jgi:pimeloyl-ACP methyl ester carboxylesterase
MLIAGHGPWLLQFAVVGHDFGAALAWRLATQAPSRVVKMVAISVGSPGAAQHHLSPRREESLRFEPSN